MIDQVEINMKFVIVLIQSSDEQTSDISATANIRI